MIFLAEKARRLRMGWGKRPFTEDDFHVLRRRHGVLLLEVGSAGRPWEGLNWKGYYTTVEGAPTIVVNEALRGIKRLRVQFHEFGHHLLHAPETCFFSDSSVEKTEVEAEVFALVALIPTNMLRKMSTWHLFEGEEELFPLKLIKKRFDIYFRYGI